MLQSSSKIWGIPGFVLSRSSLKVSCASGNSVSHNSLYMSVQAHKQCENSFIRFLHFLRLLPIVLAKCVLSLPMFLSHFSGGLAKLVKSHFSEVSIVRAYPNVGSCASLDYTWTQTHSFFVLMGGFMLYVNEKPYHTLQPDEVLKLIHTGCIGGTSLSTCNVPIRCTGSRPMSQRITLGMYVTEQSYRC
jgi:hypothetical protein